jgi:hypothetical protein
MLYNFISIISLILILHMQLEMFYTADIFGFFVVYTYRESFAPSKSNFFSNIAAKSC